MKKKDVKKVIVKHEGIYYGEDDEIVERTVDEDVVITSMTDLIGLMTYFINEGYVLRQGKYRLFNPDDKYGPYESTYEIVEA